MTYEFMVVRIQRDFLGNYQLATFSGIILVSVPGILSKSEFLTNEPVNVHGHSMTSRGENDPRQ